MKHTSHHEQAPRLRRVEGQVRGILRMVDEERYCVEILTQLRAVRAAVRRVEESVLREHIEHCLVDAARRAKRADQQARIDELVDVISRFSG